MRSLVITVCVVVFAVTATCCSKSSPAAPSSSIDGVAATGAKILGTADATWTVSCQPIASSGTPCPTSGFQAAQLANLGYADWMTPPAGSAWVGMNAQGTIPGGNGDDQERFTYVYRLTVTLNGSPATARVTLNWACDNYFHGWRVNDAAFRDVQSQNVNWRTLKTLTIDSTNANLVRGANTIDIRVVGDGLTDGLLVANVSTFVQ